MDSISTISQNQTRQSIQNMSADCFVFSAAGCDPGDLHRAAEEGDAAECLMELRGEREAIIQPVTLCTAHIN